MGSQHENLHVHFIFVDIDFIRVGSRFSVEYGLDTIQTLSVSSHRCPQVAGGSNYHPPVSLGGLLSRHPVAQGPTTHRATQKHMHFDVVTDI